MTAQTNQNGCGLMTIEGRMETRRSVILCSLFCVIWDYRAIKVKLIHS
jgi:hypothetical protein